MPVARPRPEWSVGTPQEQARGTSGERTEALPFHRGTALIQPHREEVGVGSPVLGSRWGGRSYTFLGSFFLPIGRQRREGKGD